MREKFSMHYSGTYSNGVQFSDVSSTTGATKRKCIEAAKFMSRNIKDMRGPAGEEIASVYCYVVSDANSKTVWG